MLISQKNVITRKDHQCWGCGNLYPKGTEMEANTSTDCGKIFTVYFCDKCVDFLETIPMIDMPETWGFGEVALEPGYEDFIKNNKVKV